MSPLRRHAYDPARYSATAQYPRYNPPASETSSVQDFIPQKSTAMYDNDEDPFISNPASHSQTREREQRTERTVTPLQQIQEKTRARVEKTSHEQSMSNSPSSKDISTVSGLSRTVLRDPYQVQSPFPHASTPHDTAVKQVDANNVLPSQERADDSTSVLGIRALLDSLTESEANYCEPRVKSFQPTVGNKGGLSGKQIIGQNFNAPSLVSRFQSTAISKTEADNIATGRPSYEEELNTFWASGSKNRQRNQEHCDRMLATNTNPLDASQEATTRVLYTALDNLISLKEDSRKATPDYFARYVEPPAFCIDRNSIASGGVGTLGQRRSVSLFGEPGWTEAPQRVGRDPRYRHLHTGAVGGSGFRGGRGRSRFGP